MPRTSLAKIRKWTLRSLAVIVALLLIAATLVWYFGGPYAQQIIHAKLQGIVSGHLNATLRMGKIQYSYPYGVTVDDVALIGDPDGQAVTLASFKQLRMQLTELPYGKGPLKIESIEVDEPTLHLIRTPEGFVGKEGIIREPSEKKIRNAPQLSEVFLLRRVAINDARVLYEDHRQPDQQPLVWQQLDVNLDSTPHGAVHDFQFAAHTGDLAHIVATGKIDLDQFVLDLVSLNIQTSVSPDQTASPLPPQITRQLAAYGITGKATIDIAGRFDARQPEQTDAKVKIQVENATAKHPDIPDPMVDLDLTLAVAYANGDLNLKVDFLSARTGSMGVSVQPFNVLMTVASKKWTASDIRIAAAYAPTELTKSMFSQPATLFVVAQATQGADPMQVAVDLTGSSLTLPNLNDELKLTGPVQFHSPKISIPGMKIEGLGGRTEVEGEYDTESQQTRLSVKAETLSLASLKVLINPAADRELKGLLTGNLQGQIRGTDVATIKATGEGWITHAAFARVPVLSDITDFLKIGRGLFVADNAFAKFQAVDQKIHFDRLGVRTDMVRVRGSGQIGFDQKLDLRLYVIGTGDWGEGIKSTGIPVISDLAGALAGGAQSVIRGVTSQFTSLRVTGTVAQPHVMPDPAPAITDTVKKIFEWEEKK